MTADPTRLMQAAEGYLELDLPAEALKSLYTVEKSFRGQFAWQFLAGLALQNLKRYAEALEFLEHARELKTDAVPVYVSLGICYKRVDKLNAAIQAMHQADEVCRKSDDDDHHALVMYNLSCYYALAHRKDEMLHWLAKSFTKDSSYRKLVDAESDFDFYRRDEDFLHLTNPPDDFI